MAIEEKIRMGDLMKIDFWTAIVISNTWTAASFCTTRDKRTLALCVGIFWIIIAISWR
jgi:hypothetical protein